MRSRCGLGVVSDSSTTGATPQPPSGRLDGGVSPDVSSTSMSAARGTWFLPVVGAVIGLALGILVSMTTDVPFVPEAGLLLGALAGWLSRRFNT